MKNSNDNIGNRTRKLRLVAQFFNQLRHRVLPIKVLFTPYTVILITYIYIYIYIYRAFHNVLRDYKYLQEENQRTYLNGIVHRDRKTEKKFFFDN